MVWKLPYPGSVCFLLFSVLEGDQKMKLSWYFYGEENGLRVEWHEQIVDINIK